MFHEHTLPRSFPSFHSSVASILFHFASSFFFSSPLPRVSRCLAAFKESLIRENAYDLLRRRAASGSKERGDESEAVQRIPANYLNFYLLFDDITQRFSNKVHNNFKRLKIVAMQSQLILFENFKNIQARF